VRECINAMLVSSRGLYATPARSECRAPRRNGARARARAFEREREREREREGTRASDCTKRRRFDTLRCGFTVRRLVHAQLAHCAGATEPRRGTTRRFACVVPCKLQERRGRRGRRGSILNSTFSGSLLPRDNASFRPAGRLCARMQAAGKQAISNT